MHYKSEIYLGDFVAYFLVDRGEGECIMPFVKVGKGGSVYLHSDR